MRFTAQEEYGLRCMLQFARHCQGSAGQTEGGGRSLTIGEIAGIEGLSPQYAGKLIRILRMGGLLESVRGRHGGYRLARPLENISVGEVLAVLGGRVFEPAYCSRYTGDRKLCVHSVDCAIRSLWGALQATMDGILSKIFMKDLMGQEQKVAKWLRSTVHSPPGPPEGAGEAVPMEGVPEMVPIDVVPVDAMTASASPRAMNGPNEALLLPHPPDGTAQAPQMKASRF